jgi:uncharacterized NAD(P)/FAD-binding protein YdhS
MERMFYDIAVIGSGIACSMTLCELARRLKDTPLQSRTLRIGVIEKEGEFWNGIPYGRRSLVGALAFQKLQDFLDEPERTSYIEWLAAHKESWLKTLREIGGPGGARWISENQAFIEHGKWEQLYLPRFLFGMYISGRAACAVDQFANTGQATVTLIQGEVTAIFRGAGSSHIIAVQDRCGTRSSFNTERVVLAIGSPPQRSVYTDAVGSQRAHTHIDNLYSPSEEISVQRIHHALSSLPDKRMANILILGSNASSLEVLYLINYRPDIRNLVNSVVVLSRSGLLPYKICEQTVEFELAALEALRQSSSFSADDLMAAIAYDLQRAEELKLNIADLHNAVGTLVSQLIGLMHIKEQERFICRHGVHFSKRLRRAGRDTRDAADELASLGILTMVKGEFRRLEPSAYGDGLVSAIYTGPGCQGAVTHPVAFSITINCSGFEELDGCSSELINSVIDNDLCKVNSTNRGFLVNDRLEAKKNFYVIGPLLAGNFNDKVRLWHVESASRIFSLSKLLAESLYHSLSSAIESRSSDTDIPIGVMASDARPTRL